MFEYGSDIAVFHGALVSSLERAEFLMDLNSEESCSKENICLQLKKKHCMKIAHAISDAFHELHLEFSSGYEKVDLHRRVHASAFYAAMSSVGKPKDYEGYFESLNGIFPVIDWCLYFELVKAFQWNEYYIECVTALPLDVASKFVELTVNHFQEEPLDYNNMLLDSCIEIIFRHCHFYISHSPSCKEGVSKDTNQEQDKFSNKISPEETISTLEGMVKHATQCINLVWSFVPEEPMASNISAIKISINILLTFFKCMKNSKYEEFALNFIESNSNKTFAMSTSEMCEKLCNSPVKKDEILVLLKYTEDMIKEACRILASCRGKTFITYMYEDFGSTCSWENTSFGSLFHQFVEHLNEFIIVCSILDVPTELQDVISSIKEISVIVNEHSFEASKWLSEVHKLLLWSADTSLHKYHVMMGSVVEKQTFITEESTLELLERSTDILCKPEYIPTLIEIILNYKSPQKERIIKIFLETFQNLEFQEQKSTLSMIIKSHGVTEVFKSSDFNTQLVHFLNQIVKEEKLGSKMHLQVLALCLQSSCDVIQQIISQAIKNKGGIATLVQILKIISFICNYKDDLHSPSLLIKCLCNIIKDEDVSKQQKENLISLIQVLLQQKSKDEYEVLSSGDVLLWCILPYLQVSTSAGLLDICIGLLQIVITEVKFWTEEVRKVAVVWCLHQVLEHYTLQRNGEKRQVIIITINLLMSKDISYTEKDLKWLAAHIKNINLVWHLCFELRFFGKSIQQEELEEMPVGDILTGGNFGLTVEMSSIALQTKLHKMNPVLRYSYLVISLSKILLYGISDEWIFCFDAATLSLDDDLQISFMGNFNSDIRKANKNLSKALHTFVDALILLNAAKVSSTPWRYIISCFNKLVKHIMKEAENDNTFNAFIFCEICRIGSTLDSVYAPDIIVPLLDIANLCKDVYSDDEYLRMFVLNAIDTISASDAIENLKKILIQTKV